MSLLVRKINKAKWFQMDIKTDNDVTGDAITNCLRTSNNALSVWGILAEDDVEDAILALISNQDHLETIDIVILDEKYFREYEIEIIPSPGNTPIKSLINMHKDISNLTYSKIGTVKESIVESIRNDKMKRYTKGASKKLLIKALEENRINITDLNPLIQKKVS